MKEKLSGFFRKYPHWVLLLYWIVYGLVFELLEWFVKPDYYHIMYCPLDDMIPFCELFIIPYYYWFIALIGIHIYTFFKDPLAFKKLMCFIICANTLSVIMFMVYPSMQLLRPESMPRDNVLTDLVSYIYAIDTNTNVCPSLHVVDGVAVWLAAMNCKSLRTKGWQIFFGVSTVLICISTVFLKQHSLLDIPAGLCVCILCYPLAFGKRTERYIRLIDRRKKQRPILS